MRRGYDRVQASIGRSYDEIKLSEISTVKKFEKLIDCLSIAEVVDMDVEVASNDEFMRGGGCVGKKR